MRTIKTTSTKTDSAAPADKLALRLYYMRTYHRDGDARVFDCCQGSGQVWSQVRHKFDVARYWGVDVKPKRGRLAVDSAEVLRQPGWTDNVIDIDTYGMPWEHWSAMLPNITEPTTVFLTLGKLNLTPATNDAVRSAGITFPYLPATFASRVETTTRDYQLQTAKLYGLRIEDVRTTPQRKHQKATYIGLRLYP